MSCWKDNEQYDRAVKPLALSLAEHATLYAKFMATLNGVCETCAASAVINAYGNALAMLHGDFVKFTPEQDAEFCRQLTQLIMTNNASHRCPPTPSEN